MNGIPIGAPNQRPDPKSAWLGLAGPMEFTYAADIGCTGSVSMRAFQTLLAGNTGQLPSVCELAGWTTAQHSNARAPRVILRTSLGYQRRKRHRSGDLLATAGMS